MNLYITTSKRKIRNTIYQIVIEKYIISFGASLYSDYTIHKDSDRKTNYLSRHKTNENWGVTGIKSAGFWSRWVLWNLPTLQASISDANQRFNINVKLI